MSFDTSSAREPLFTEREAASLLGISHSYIRLLRAQRRISCYHFGGRVVYAEKHITEFKSAAERRASALVAA